MLLFIAYFASYGININDIHSEGRQSYDDVVLDTLHIEQTETSDGRKINKYTINT